MDDEPTSPKPDRQAYLAEQIERQKRGEPVDVEWVKAELGRVRDGAGGADRLVSKEAALAGHRRRGVVADPLVQERRLDRGSGLLTLGWSSSACSPPSA